MLATVLFSLYIEIFMFAEINTLGKRSFTLGDLSKENIKVKRKVLIYQMIFTYN